MKKIVSMFLLIALLFTTTYAMTNEKAINIDIAKELEGVSGELKTQKIAELLTAEQSPSQFKSYNEAVNFSNEYDRQLFNEFNKLTTEDKYEVLDIINKDNKSITRNLELNQVINSVIEDLKKDDIFILDLSEEEIIAKINEKSGTISTISTISLLECTADVKNFNQSINYAEWDSSYGRPYTYAFYYNDVRTGIDDDEYICDVELWYYHYYQNVWAMTSASRWVITYWYNGVLGRRYVGPDGINTIVIGFKAIIGGQTPESLYQNVVLW